MPSMLRLASTLLASLMLLACDDGGAPSEDDRGIDLPDGGEVADAAPRPESDAADLGLADDDAAFNGPRINSLIPNRGPLEGGTSVRVIGHDFTETTVIHIDGVACAEQTFEGPNRIVCVTPPAELPAKVHVSARWADGGEPFRLDEAFTYYQSVSIASIDPVQAGVRGGIDVTVNGRGFIEPTEVRFGDTPATNVRIQNAQRLLARVPAGDPGVVDVTVRNVNGEGVLPGAFTYTEALAISGLEPRWGFATGDTEVVISGGGLVEETTVRFGAAVATVVASELNRERLRVRTPAGEAGTVAVELENVNGTWREADAFLYVDPAAGGFAVVGAVPRRVPTRGGESILVGGSGFTAATEVRVDGELTGCELVAEQLLRCIAPPHARGAVEVVVSEGGEEAAVPGGLFYYERLELFDVTPARGAIAGGTVVQVRGEGLTPDTELFLEGAPMQVLEVTDGTTALAITPPGRSGIVPLQGVSPDDQTLLPDAYEYFDPVTRFGGVWGDPITGAVNVTVLDAYTSDPLAESTVLAVPLDGSDDMTGVTDANGQVTLSRLGLVGPLNITGARIGYEVYTIERVTAENVTVYLFPHVPPEGQGPPGDPIPPARLTGFVTGLDKLEKPVDEGMRLAAFVDTTHSSPFNRRALPWPEPNGILYEDGPFEVFARPGEMAVVVTAAWVSVQHLEMYAEGRMGYWDMRVQVTPLAMGIRRYISVSPGAAAENLAVDIDRPMDLQIPVTLGNPSGGVPGAPTNFKASVLIDFGAEGFWELDARAEDSTHRLRVQYLPELTQWLQDEDLEFEWIGEAEATEGLGYPYAMAFTRTRDIREGVTIGPFVGTPEAVHPTDGGALAGNRVIEWTTHPGVEGDTEPAHVNVIQISGGDGLPLWTYVTPGPVNRYELPVLPDDILPGGLHPGESMYLTIVPMILDRRFEFEDFTLEDLGFWNRKSFAVTSIQFTKD